MNNRDYNDYNEFLTDLNKKSFKSIIKNVLELDFDELRVRSMDKSLSDRIYNHLIKNDFYITRTNYKVIKYNPLFLLVSLEKDFKKTISVLSNLDSDDLCDTPCFDREDTLIEENLTNNLFLINSKTMNLPKINAAFLLSSLKTDFKKTLKVLQNCKEPFFYLSKYQGDELLKMLFKDNDVEFNSLPKVIKHSIVKYVNRFLDSEDSYVKELVIDGVIPQAYLSSSALNSDYNFIQKICGSNELARTIIYSRLDYSKSSDYSEYDEMELLKALGVDYKKCKNVEEAIQCMHWNRLNRENMTLIEMYAIQFYGMKRLHNLGIDIAVNVFQIDEKMTNMGSNDERSICLCINEDVKTIPQIIQTLNHEIEHAVQDRDVSRGDIINDNDVDVYSKDRILREILGNEYYLDNYGVISYEFDADFKASIKTAKLLELFDYVFEKNVEDIKTNAKNAVKHANKNVDYYFEIERSPDKFMKDVPLNEIFERNMEKKRQRDIDGFKRILKAYPIVEYEYNIAPNFKRKTIEELVANLDSASTKEMGIYYNLLVSRIDDRKEYEQDIEENVEHLERLQENNNLRPVTRKILKSLVKKANDFNFMKYEGYYYRNGGTKR